MYQKYHSQKCIYDNKVFASKKEMIRYKQLQILLAEHKISDLKTQVPFELIPSQKVNGKIVERPCKYIADFTYIENGQLVVEDAKGFKTSEYRVKKKLMLFVHGIQIREV